MSQKFRKLAILLTSLLLLSGCIGKQQWEWQHPQNPGDEAKRLAIAECEKIASEELRPGDYYLYFPYPSYFDRHVFKERYPYYWNDYYLFRAQQDFFERQRYFRICMKAKGWQLVKLPAP